MKSIQNETTMQCPHKCEEFDAAYWAFIDATGSPDLKDAVLGGELNLFQCPKCQTFFHYDTPIIYFDAVSELLVFVFANQDKAQEAALRAKMQQDYELLKNSILKELHMDYQPICVFGLEGLKEVLVREEELNFESEVVAGAAATLGLKIVRLKPSYAREHQFPFYVAVRGDSSAPAFAVAASKVLKCGIKSTLLQNFMEKMSVKGGEPPLMLYVDTKKIQGCVADGRCVC